MNTKNIVIGVVILIFLAGGAWYWMKKESVIGPQDEKKEETGLGAQIFEKAQNPLGERLPDINPFSADTNPFDARTNPFKSEYKNPFQ